MLEEGREEVSYGYVMHPAGPQSRVFSPKHYGAVRRSRGATRTIAEGECEAPALWASDMGQVPALFPRDGSGEALCRVR